MGEDYYNVRRPAGKSRGSKRRRKAMIRRAIFAVVVIALIAVIVILCVKLFGGNSDNNPTDTVPFTTTGEESEAQTSASETQGGIVISDNNAVIESAKLAFAQYDYDGALEELKAVPNYTADSEITSLIEDIENEKASAVTVDVTQVPHVFFHTLIVDFERCFDSSHNQSLLNGYNAWMITIEEFEKTIQQLYDNNFVIINISDLYTKDANGNYSQNTSIKLPASKKAIVFSYDDPAYYCQYMDWGMADRMVFDANGDIKLEYTDRSGNTTTGNYDHVPILIDFCREHPDFSYKGHKGTMALTGYNGVFGYRTEYRMFDNASSDEQAWLNANTWCKRENLDDYIAEAKVMAQALKDNGFEFASHSWGHRHFDQKSLDWLKQDTSWWKERVESIVGETDILVYPHGSDIAGTEDYTDSNEKYAYLKSQGFGVFCGVDGSSYTWNQFRSSYVRQSRIDIDGYLMYQTITGKSSTLTKLGLDVEAIFDTRRPTPVVAG